MGGELEKVGLVLIESLLNYSRSKINLLSTWNEKDTDKVFLVLTVLL